MPTYFRTNPLVGKQNSQCLWASMHPRANRSKQSSLPNYQETWPRPQESRPPLCKVNRCVLTTSEKNRVSPAEKESEFGIAQRFFLCKYTKISQTQISVSSTFLISGTYGKFARINNFWFAPGSSHAWKGPKLYHNTHRSPWSSPEGPDDFWYLDFFKKIRAVHCKDPRFWAFWCLRFFNIKKIRFCFRFRQKKFSKCLFRSVFVAFSHVQDSAKYPKSTPRG